MRFLWLRPDLNATLSTPHTHRTNVPTDPFACREYGLHAIDLQRLNGDVAGVRVRKLKSRLVVALVKATRGSYSRPSPWTKLQAAPEKPSD